ncbi:MAG TPA: hypothetical protein VKU00_01330 [Chthonomonadaceae bacterium]|nr:hypothetical protein [Chthonomonadaceae bacterium]
MTDDLITLHIFAEDYTAPLSWRLAQWCRQLNADEWTVNPITVRGAGTFLFDYFDEIMTPYRRSRAARRHLSASRPEDLVRPTNLWQLSSASLAALQEFLPNGLFTSRCSDEGWFEDPILYRNGESMLGIVSHEAEGILRVTYAERLELEREGFPLRAVGAYVGY